MSMPDLQEELKRSHGDVQLEKLKYGKVTSKEKLEDLFLPFSGAMSRFRPNLGACFLNLLDLFPIDETGAFVGEFHEMWESTTEGLEKFSSLEWKIQVTALFLHAGYIWKNGKKFKDALEKFKKLRRKFEEEAMTGDEAHDMLDESEDGEMGNPLDTSVVFSPHKYQISPGLFRSSADRQEVEVLFEDIAEVLLSTNSYFRVKLKDDFDIEWQMSGGGNYPLAFFKTLALVRWNVKQRSGAELIELSEDEGRDQLRALAKQPLESEEAFWRNVDKIKLLFKNLKDSIQGVVGAHQRMGPLENQIAELLLARCKESTCVSLQSLALNRELRNWKKSNMRPEKISLDEIFHWGRILKTRSKTTTTSAQAVKGELAVVPSSEAVVNVSVANEPMVQTEQAVVEGVGKKRSSGSEDRGPGHADSEVNSLTDLQWYGNYPARGSVPTTHPQGVMFPRHDPFFNFYAQGHPSMYPFPIQGPVGNVPTFYQASGQAPPGPGRTGQDQAAFDPSTSLGGYPGRGGEGDGGPNQGYRGRGRGNQDGYHNGGRGSFKGGYGRGQGGQKGHGGRGRKGGRGRGNPNHNYNYNNNNYNQNNSNYKNQRSNSRGAESDQSASSALQNLLSGGVVDAETTRKMGEALIQAAQRMAATASSSSNSHQQKDDPDGHRNESAKKSSVPANPFERSSAQNATESVSQANRRQGAWKANFTFGIDSSSTIEELQEIALQVKENDVSGGCTFLLDSGANISMVKDSSVLFDVQSGPEFQVLTAGGTVVCDKVGKLRLQLVCPTTNTCLDEIIVNVRVCPLVPISLLSLDDVLGHNYHMLSRGSRNALKSHICSEDGTLKIDVLQRDRLYFLQTVRMGDGKICVECNSLTSCAGQGDRQSVKVSGPQSNLNGADSSVGPSSLVTLKPAETGFETTCEQSGLSATTDSTVWHLRLGHLEAKIQKLLADSVKYITYNRRLKKSPCHICRIAKFVSRPTHRQSDFRQERASEVNQVWHIDLKDMIIQSEPGGFRYFLIIVDVFSGFVRIRPMRSKSQTASILMEILLQEDRNSSRPKVQKIISDNGSEFSSVELESFVVDRGIRYDKIPEYSQVYNGFAERGIRSVTSIHRTLLRQSGVPKSKWEYSIMQAVLLYNVLPSGRNLGYLSPYLVYTGEHFDFRKLRVFGCSTFFKNELRTSKVEDPGIHGINLGNAGAFPGYTVGYLVWDIEHDRIVHTNNLTFDEMYFPLRCRRRIHTPYAEDELLKELVPCASVASDDDEESSENASETELQIHEEVATSGRKRQGESVPIESEVSAGKRLKLESRPSTAQGVSEDHWEDKVEHRLADDTEYVPDGAMSPVPLSGRRTRRDFKEERGVLESKYVNRDVEVLVNGQVERGKILQMVFKEGEFLARIVFPTLDNYWILRHVNDPDVKFLERSERQAMVVLTNEEKTSEVCMLADYYSCSFPPNVFGDISDHTKVFTAHLDRAADDILDVVGATVGGSPEVVVLSQHEQFPHYLQVTNIVQGSTESDEILYVWDRAVDDMTSLQPVCPRFVPVWRDCMYNNRLQHVDPVSSAPQVSADVDPTFRDARLLVANLALISPVWDAVELASDLLSLMSCDRDSPAAGPGSQADFAMTAACDAGNVEDDNTFDGLPDPKTRSEMLRRPDRHLWQQAEKEEIAKIESRGVWEVVTRDQKKRECNHSVLARGLWVYASKRDLKGKILKRKGRLVIMGNLLPSSEELFAPTTSLDNIRLLLSIAAGNRWKITFRDISSAFLYGDLEVPVYLIPPDVMCLPPECLLRVLKSLYGLRIAPRRWYLKFTQVLKTVGASGIGHDEIIYRYSNCAGEVLLLTVFVDDLLIVSQSEAVKIEFLEKLNTVFDFSGSEATGTFLGIRIDQDFDQGRITLSQQHFIEKIVERFEIVARGVKTVLPGCYLKTYHLEGKLLSKKDIRTYQSLLGSILYVANCTRVDIAFATSVLSRFARAPRESDMEALVHLAQYLHTTREVQIVYHCNGVSYNKECFVNEMIAFSDAGWGTEIITRRSQSGYGIVLNGGVVVYGSKMQKVVSLSSSEAEIYAATTCAKLVKLYRNLLSQMGFMQTRPTLLLIDNEPCLRLLWDKRSYSRLKHIDIRTKYAVDLVEKEELYPEKIHTSYQPGDLLTKVLPLNRWRVLGEFLFGGPLPDMML